MWSPHRWNPMSRPSSAPRSNRLAAALSAAGASVGVALLLGAIELLKTTRASDFNGLRVSCLPGWLLAVAIYAVAIGALAAVMTRIASRLRFSCPALTAACAAAAILWMPLVALAKDTSALAALPAGCLALADVVFALPWIRRPPRASALAWLVLLSATIGALRLATGAVLPTPIRHDGSNRYLFIVADALRADYCSTYGGHVPTPNMDRLAARGVLYENAIAPAPWTLPSMFSIAHRGIFPLPPSGVPTNFADGSWLPSNGALPGILVGNWLLGAEGGLLEPYAGHTAPYAVLNSLQPERQHFFSGAPFLAGALKTLDLYAPTERPLDTTRELVEQLLSSWNAVPEGSGIYLHLMDPHDPYAPPRAFAPAGLADRFFSPSPARDWGAPMLDEARQIKLEPKQQEEAKALYEAEIRYVDASLGRILNALDAADCHPAIVFLADHGEEFWDHGGYYHGHTLYQEQLHVPLIVSAPGLRPRREPGFFGLTGVLPLLQQVLTGAAPPQPSSDQPVFAYGTVQQGHPMHRCAVIQEGWKLIEHRGGTTFELYDLSTDPQELRDLSATQTGRVAELRALLDAWKAAASPWGETGGADDGVLERMRSLGYL